MEPKQVIIVNAVSTDMARSEHRPIADRILEEVRRAPDCELDALVQNLPDLTWQDVVLGVQRLRGTKQLQLSPRGAGIYTVRVPNEFGKSNGLLPMQGGVAIRQVSTPRHPAN